MVFVVGACGHGKQVIDILLMMNEQDIHVVDDDKERHGFMYYLDFRVMIGSPEKILKYGDRVALGLGGEDLFAREKMIKRLVNIGVVFINVISPLARLSPGVDMGVGNYIGHFSVISGGSKIGDHNIINDMVCVTHDVLIGDYNHICPGSVLGGGVVIGDINLIGCKTNVNPLVCIGCGNLIGSGASIIRDIGDYETFVGVPARICL